MSQRTRNRNASGDSAAVVEQPSVNLNKSENSPEKFAQEVANVSEPRKLSDDDLLGFCQSAFRRYKFHYLADLRPFFLELWERIEGGRIPNVPTKTEACRLIGCSLRWAEEIVADTAHEPKKPAKVEPTDEQIAREIQDYADETLRVLIDEDWDRYQTICERLANEFDKVGKHERHNGGPEMGM